MAVSTVEYDVFLSCPMAGMKNDARYQEVRAEVLSIVDCLEKECKFQVFYAGRDVEARTDFDADFDFSLAKDIRTLEESQYYLLYYPEKVLSSVLVEAGIALALKKSALYFVHDRRHLPFMLRKAETVAPVKVCEFKTVDAVLAVIRNYGKGLFEPWATACSVSFRSAEAVLRGTSSGRVSIDVRLRVLQQAIPVLSEDLRALQQVLGMDISSSLNKIRYIAEKILHRLCRQAKVNWGQAEPTLERMLGPLVAHGCLPKNLAIHARTIQANTSPGSHYQESALSESHAAIAQWALVELLEWFATLPDEPAEPGQSPD